MEYKNNPIGKKDVIKISIALLLAVRCKNELAVNQLLAYIYHNFPENQAKTVMNRLIYLLEAQERDWMRGLV